MFDAMSAHSSCAGSTICVYAYVLGISHTMASVKTVVYPPSFTALHTYQRAH